jgi:hypothetical protein
MHCKQLKIACALLLLLQLPKLMELVGLGYTSWFIYRYLLFKVRPLQDLFSDTATASSTAASPRTCCVLLSLSLIGMQLQ